MKNAIRSFSTFTRTERWGILALSMLLLVLLIVKATMHLWLKPAVAGKELVEYKMPVNVQGKVKEHNSGVYTAPGITKGIPAEKINLNTADSLILISLPGIGKGLSHRILQRRRELGKFDNMDQVFEVYRFKEETRQLLQEHTYVE